MKLVARKIYMHLDFRCRGLAFILAPNAPSSLGLVTGSLMSCVDPNLPLCHQQVANVDFTGSARKGPP